MSKPAPSTKRVLSAAAAAYLISVRPRTIRRMAENLALPCDMTSGGHRRFSEADVLARQKVARDYEAGMQTATAARIALHAVKAVA